MSTKPTHTVRPMRSDMIKKGFERAPHRALLRATGVIQSEDDWNKPFIALQLLHRHHSRPRAPARFGEVVGRRCGRRAACRSCLTPSVSMTASLWATCGMKYCLAEPRADRRLVESMVKAHWFDGLICIPNCDKIVPGMLMASMRAEHPDDLHQRRADGSGCHTGTESDRSDSASSREWARIVLARLMPPDWLSWRSSPARRAARAQACSPPIR